MRRIRDEGVVIETFSDISDQQLDRLVRRIKLQHPYDGERLMIGHLAREGVRVERTRLRGSIHRIDPINTAIRRSVAIRRRVYHSNGPNHTWHIDGNHKLIRWRLVIHGGIDGFSRTIVYLHCANNNRAQTVVTQFCKATSAYGIPLKIHSDLGGENVDVWRCI